MNALRPFFLLAGRPAVFAVGAFSLFFSGITVIGLASGDARVALHFDAVFVAALLFPGLAGWLGGAIIQEFQHTSFAMLLPRVRSRIASGFLTAGLVVAVVVVGLIALRSSTSMNIGALFAVAVGAFCLGGIFIDPLSNWITTLNTIVMLLLIGRSRDMAEFVTAHPLLTSVIALAIGVAGCFRLFARSTFRRKPFVPTAPLPGRFSLERAQERLRKWESNLDFWRARSSLQKALIRIRVGGKSS